MTCSLALRAGRETDLADRATQGMKTQLMHGAACGQVAKQAVEAANPLTPPIRWRAMLSRPSTAENLRLQIRPAKGRACKSKQVASSLVQLLAHAAHALWRPPHLPAQAPHDDGLATAPQQLENPAGSAGSGTGAHRVAGTIRKE